MAKKSIELFLLPVENDDQKREIYSVIDNNTLEETVKDSFMLLSNLLETAKEKFYAVRSNAGPDTYQGKLSQLINEAVSQWRDGFSSMAFGVITLDPEAVFEIQVVGKYTFTFEYSSGIQRVLDKDKSVYQIGERVFKPTDDIVSAISRANKILLQKSNFPIHRLRDSAISHGSLS